ncbi:uncharacterized protein [Anabrus simplex]|uniref:uncharacterized protein n=1 Tax=Anabrus simplex TaxID=316456 RepID=UPI0035A30265
MKPPFNIVRVALYCLTAGFLLYLSWPLLTGQEPSRSPKRTPSTLRRKISRPVVNRRNEQASRNSSTVHLSTIATTLAEYNYPPLDAPIQEIVVMAAWKQTNCGNTTDPLRFNITHLEFEAGEHLVIAFDFELDIELSAPIQVDILQWTMVSDDDWRLVPCGEIKGSCYMEDLCSSFAQIKCPALRGLIQPNLQCPILPGKYSVPDHYYPTVVEDYLLPVATRYHFKHHGQHIACYDLVVIGEKL